jgi:pimeloyl-ACP methyl ester carboxylesterase
MVVTVKEDRIQLYDGRWLAFARYGVPGGTPVLYFTGGNSSRIEGEWFAAAAEMAGIDLIVPDRPGFGLSDFQPGRRLLDWPEDVSHLADRLSLDHFAVFGLSGGGPHTLSAAYKLPGRITQAAVVSGVAPPEMPDRYQGMWAPVRMIFWTGRYMPAANRVLLKQMAGFYSDPVEMKNRMLQGMPPPDAALIERHPEIAEIFARSAQEAHRSGLDGDAWEWRLYSSPWGFQLRDIRIEVSLWYGLYDRQAPVGMGRYLHQELTRSRLVEVEDGGHFSTINNHIEEIFKYLIHGEMPSNGDQDHNIRELVDQAIK